MAEDWYRSGAWAGPDQEDFERRLGRARATSRPQYLRIKALALRDAGRAHDAVALLERLLQDHPDSFDVPFAHELLGDLHHESAQTATAEAHYRAALDAPRYPSGTTGEVHLSLAELLLDTGDPSSADEVDRLLREGEPHLTMTSSVFRLHLLRARHGELTGDAGSRQASARQALELVGAPPQFSRHPTVGRAEPSEAVLQELRRLARP